MIESKWILLEKINYKHILVFAFVIKFLASTIFPSLTSILDNSAEFSTPISSWKSVQEGIFLLHNGMNPYDGGVVHHSPILLHFFAHIKNSLAIENPLVWNAVSSLIFLSVDLLTSVQILQICSKFMAQHKVFSSLQNRYLILVSIIFNFNPVGFLSSLSNSSSCFSNFWMCSCFYSLIILENYVLSSAALGVASYLSYNPVFLIIPFIAAVKKFDTVSNVKWFVALLTFISTIVALIYSSYFINNENWNFLMATYGTIVFFKKINPNIGLWWYFFIEMFNFFSNFFIGVFNIYNSIYVLPITIRFYNCKYSNLEVNNKYVIFPIIISYGFTILTKSYPTLNDLSFFFELLTVLVIQNNFVILSYLRYPIASILLIVHAILLSPIFYYLWIFSGSGNSNFFYAINLVYSLGLSSILIDFIWSYLSMEYIYFKKGREITPKDSKIRLTQI